MKSTMLEFERRKNEHLMLAMKHVRLGVFDKIDIKTIEPCGLDFSDIDTSTIFLNKSVPYPNYINAITGGGKLSQKINSRLSILAKEFDIPIMTGSLNYYIKTGDFEPFKSFLKNDFVIANLSARNNLEDMKKVTDKLKTPYICLHLNTFQELLQLGGDLEFKKETNNIEDAINFFGDKLIIKAVGQGMTRETIRNLMNLGVKNIDISGSGGTDFSLIEAKRSGLFYKKFPSVKTFDSINNFLDVKDKQILIASGGIDTPLDIAKALALGSDMTASAHYYLNLVTINYKDACSKILEDRRLFKAIMLISSSQKLKDLKDKYLLKGEINEN